MRIRKIISNPSSKNLFFSHLNNNNKKLHTKLLNPREKLWDNILSVDAIVENPLYFYNKFKLRLEKDGILASFPEFCETIEYLQSTLEGHSIIKDLAKDNKQIAESLSQIKNNLFHLNFNFTIEGKDYPHIPPAQGKFPYLPSIIEIEKTLGFMDACFRAEYNNIPPLYHNNRYKYHSFGFYKYNEISNPIILLPTMHSLSLEHFIKARSAPLGFVGISGQSSPAVFADAYYNTPLDFWVHDLNHNRRYASYNRLYLKAHDCKPKVMHQRLQTFISNIILPSIKITSDLPLKEKYLRQIICLLYFELLHEYALTPDKESIKQAFKHLPGAASPFEHMINPQTFNKAELEAKLRLPNNNLNSGFSLFEDKQKENITIRYFFDKGPNFLTSTYNKLLNGFYDSHFQREDCFPPLAERSPELFINAAKKILLDIDEENLLSRDEIARLINIVNDKTTFIEKYPGPELKSIERNTNKKRLPALEDAITIFKTHSGFEANIMGVNAYTGTKNYVYHLQTDQGDYTLKIYNENNHRLMEEEILSYQLFSKNPMIKSLFAKGRCELSGYKFVITEHLQGQNLKTLLENQQLSLENIDAINLQMCNFINSFPQEEKNIFGRGIQIQELYGDNWKDWMDYFLKKQELKLESVDIERRNIISHYLRALKSLLREHESYLIAVKPHLIFTDLNLSNFILSDNKLTFIDLELMWSGDLLLAYGEWASQIYGTDLWINFEDKYLSSFPREQNDMIRIYALFANLISLIDAVTKGHDINTTHPWGNLNNSYIKMMDSHIQTIQEHSRYQPIAIDSKTVNTDTASTLSHGQTLQKQGIFAISSKSCAEQTKENDLNENCKRLR
jgi:hypothetical protein